MRIFETKLTVTQDDLDELNHVNNVRYVQWVNDIAKTHWHQKATPTILESYFWVLINHNIDYKKSAIINDVILLKTYVTKAEGVTSTRVVEIYNNKTNELLATSKTNWCLLDQKTKRPTRINNEIANLFN